MRGEGPGKIIKAKAKTKPKTKVKERKPAFSIGARVRHPRFGTGEVLDIEPLGTLDYVLTIHFDNESIRWKAPHRLPRKAGVPSLSMRAASIDR